MVQLVKNLPAIQETWDWSLGREDPLEEIVTHTSSLAWEIPWTEEPYGLQSMGSDNGSDTTLQLTFTFFHGTKQNVPQNHHMSWSVVFTFSKWAMAAEWAHLEPLPREIEKIRFLWTFSHGISINQSIHHLVLSVFLLKDTVYNICSWRISIEFMASGSLAAWTKLVQHIFSP